MNLKTLFSSLNTLNFLSVYLASQLLILFIFTFFIDCQDIKQCAPMLHNIYTLLLFIVMPFIILIELIKARKTKIYDKFIFYIVFLLFQFFLHFGYLSTGIEIYLD